MVSVYHQKSTKVHLNTWCIWLYVYCVASIDGAASNVTFPEDLQVWCPYTKFCDLKPAQRLDPSIKNKVPCCGSCSCSDDCGRYRNCCTSSMDHYKMDDTLRTVCKSLTVTRTIVDEQQSFYMHMVNKCPDFSFSCVDQNASIFASYHPVYSSATNLIYYNSKCADCHNISEVTPFEAAIQCSPRKESYTNVMYGVIIGNTLDSDCTIQFVPPYDIDMRSHVCHPMKITKTDCTPDSKYYALRDLCASFNATYRTHRMVYDNIYCYLCSSDRIIQEEAEMQLNLNTLCDADVFHKLDVKYAFTVLITHETLERVSSAKDNEEQRWCDAVHNEPTTATRCRTIHCPVGQYRTHDGCKVLGDRWFADAISINFVLTPQTKILVKEIKDIIDNNSRSRSEDIFLKRNVFQSWKLRLLYKSEESDEFIQHFVAQVLHVSADMSINPTSLLQMIERSLHQPWRIDLAGKSYDLAISLDVNYDYEPLTHEENGFVKIFYAPTWLIFWANHVHSRQIKRNQVLTEVTDGLYDFYTGTIFISRLFFCEQVELLPDEYIMEGHNIYLLREGKYLEEGVYTQFGIANPVYRVCLSELQGQKSSSYRQEIRLLCSTLYLFYILGRP